MIQIMFRQLYITYYIFIGLFIITQANMNEEEPNDLQDQYQIIIVQCCENCQSHQAFSRHSEWKYFEQYNQLKRKIQRFVNNTIVIKNPIPDELVKNNQDKLNKNAYINRDTNQPVTFPRIGAFQIYIYNVLIYSKLLSNNWPNHYKLIQTINKIIEAKNRGDSLEQFSVYRTYQPPEKPEKVQKVVKVSMPVKKKKKDYRVYKSKDRSSIDPSPVKKLEPVSGVKKTMRRTLLDKDRQKQLVEPPTNQRNLQTKAQKRVKLPSLRNTINFSEQLSQTQGNKQPQQKRYSQKNLQQSNIKKNKDLKRIFNSIQQFEKDDISLIERKQSIDPFNSLELDQNQSIDVKSQKENDMKFYENRSVQYSERSDKKDMMNRSIQYSEAEGMQCDFGLQIDDQSLPKEVDIQFVQTDPVIFSYETLEQLEKKKPYMLDEEVEANIIIPIPQTQEQTQTLNAEFATIQTNTDIKVTINRAQQFPTQEEEKQGLKNKTQFSELDEAFKHLYDKRRNLVDNQQQYYSIDKFQEKATKYKWIGRAKLRQPIDEIRRKMLLQAMVFCVYDYYGIKVPEKRMSFQTCTNVLLAENQKMQENALVHVMTSDNPELQYPFQFQEVSYEEHKYPLSEQLTFKSSRQHIKFMNYSTLLAIAYFLGDRQLFYKGQVNVGFVISNEEVKQIFKLNADQFRIQSQMKNQNYRSITVNNNPENNSISISRLTQYLELQFISMINKIANKQNFQELIKSLQENFIRMSPSHKKFRNTLLSMKTEKVQEDLVNQFIEMLKSRRQYIVQEFKGQLYSYQNYGVLEPNIQFSLENYKKQAALKIEDQKRMKSQQKMIIERKLMYDEKQVTSSDIEKHLRNKNTFLIVVGQAGIGKSTFISEVCKDLQKSFSQKIRITKLPRNIFQPVSEIKYKKLIDTILDDYKKQIIVIEDAQNYFMQILSFINKLYNQEDPRTKPDMSFLCSTTNKKTEVNKFKNRFISHGIQVIPCVLQPLQIDEIRTYMSKEIKYHNVTDKKNLIEEIVGNQNQAFNESHPKYNNIVLLQIPFYLNLYTEYLAHVEDMSDPQACLVTNLNRYSLFKEIHHIANNRHIQETTQMKIQYKDQYHDLRRIAYEYYHHNFEIDEIVRDKLQNNMAENQLISNQMAFYPINLNALNHGDQFLFNHIQYLNFYLCEAYCYYIQNSYRNLQMQKIYANQNVLQLIKLHYQTQRTHSKLLNILENSKKYKNTPQQASQAITLLNKLGFIFSNLNLDQVQIPDADLSKAIFYHTSLRGANLQNCILYKSQLISCQLQNTQMENISLHIKKFEIQYTVLTAALSIDGKFLALGCGNYLLIYSTQSGKQVKRIEAHLDIIRTVKYSKDNMGLVTIADDKTLRVWDTRTYKSVVFRLPQKGLIVFNYQTENIAVVNKTNVKIWNIKSMASQLVLEGHKDFVSSVQFGGEGKFIVTGSRDTTVRLWDTKTGEMLKVYKGHSSEIIASKLAPNKKMVAASSKDKQFIMWDSDSRSEILKKKFSDEITQFCMDDKQKYVIIVFAKQNDILVASLQNLDPIHYLQGHNARVISINFDIQYRRLVSLGKDKTVRIWEVDKIMQIEEKRYLQQNSQRIKVSDGQILSMAFCKQSSKYAVGHDNGQINIYESHDNRLIDQLISHNGPVKCLSYDKSGKLYAGGSDGTVRIWNLQARREPRTIQVHSSEVLQLKLNQKYRLIATSSLANELVIYDFTGIKLVMSTREEGRVHAIQFSKDERIMAVGGTEKYVAMYQIADGGGSINRLEQLGPNSDAIISMIFHADIYLVVALKNGHVAIWNHMKANIVKKIENLSPISSILSFQKKYVCLVSQDGKIRIVDMDLGKQIRTFKYPDIPTAIAINGNETVLYVSTVEGNIVEWNLNSLKPKQQKINFDRIAFDQEGNKLVQVQSARELFIRDLQFHDEQIMKIPSLESDIEGVTFYKDNIILLLKNGIHWDVDKNKEYKFGDDREMEGEMYWIRDKKRSNFYRTPVKKVKGIKLPVQAILQELFSS